MLTIFFLSVITVLLLLLVILLGLNGYLVWKDWRYEWKQKAQKQLWRERK